MTETKTYKVKTIENNNIDWSHIKKAPIGTFLWEDGYKPKSYGQAVYVKNFGFVVKLTSFEKDPLIVHKNDGDPVHEDSCLEFFVSFDENKHYFNIESNAYGARNISFKNADSSTKVPVVLKYPDDIPAKVFFDSESWGVVYTLKNDVISKYFSNYNSSEILPGYGFYGNFYHMGTDVKNNGYFYGMWNEVKSDKPNFHLPDFFGKFEID